MIGGDGKNALSNASSADGIRPCTKNMQAACLRFVGSNNVVCVFVGNFDLYLCSRKELREQRGQRQQDKHYNLIALIMQTKEAPSSHPQCGSGFIKMSMATFNRKILVSK